jgi:hypothetical protein
MGLKIEDMVFIGRVLWGIEQCKTPASFSAEPWFCQHEHIQPEAVLRSFSWAAGPTQTALQLFRSFFVKKKEVNTLILPGPGRVKPEIAFEILG